MTAFSFGHLISSSTSRAGNYKTTTRQYSTQPFDHLPPEKGKEVHAIVCNHCGAEVKVTMLSNGEIWKKRLVGLAVIAGTVLVWSLLELPSEATGFGKFVNNIEGILGIVTFMVVVWSLGKLFEDKNRVMFEIDRAGHAILWNKK